MKKPKGRGVKIDATPQQVAMYGHIAVALREWMNQNKVSIRELNDRIGLKETNTAIYNWLNCKAAPGHATRAFIVKATGIPESDLLPRSMVPSPRIAIAATLAPSARSKTQDVLGFNVDSDGMATITLHARLPLDTATPLLRMILDAGVVFTKGE